MVITFLPSKPWGGSEQQVRFLLPGATLSVPLWGNLVVTPNPTPNKDAECIAERILTLGCPGEPGHYKKRLPLLLDLN